MNEAAIRIEEEILNMFAGAKTLVYDGWIIKALGGYVFVNPFYHPSSHNLEMRVRFCEEYGRGKNLPCIFRIVEHTNYHLISYLEKNGYERQRTSLIGELHITKELASEINSQINRRKPEFNFDFAGKTIIIPEDELSRHLLGKRTENKLNVHPLSEKTENKLNKYLLNKKAEDELNKHLLSQKMEDELNGYLLSKKAENSTKTEGIKKDGSLFLFDGKSLNSSMLLELLFFSTQNNIKKIFANFENENTLPKHYEAFGFGRAYLWHRYEKEDNRHGI